MMSYKNKQLLLWCYWNVVDDQLLQQWWAIFTKQDYMSNFCGAIPIKRLSTIFNKKDYNLFIIDENSLWFFKNVEAHLYTMFLNWTLYFQKATAMMNFKNEQLLLWCYWNIFKMLWMTNFWKTDEQFLQQWWTHFVGQYQLKNL